MIEKNIEKSLRQLGQNYQELLVQSFAWLTEARQGQLQAVTNRLLRLALARVRPPVRGLGLRLTHLNSEQAEMLIGCPSHLAVRDEKMLLAMREIWTWLWRMHGPRQDFAVEVLEFQLSKIAPSRGPLKVRASLEEWSREVTLSEWQQTGQGSFQGQVQFFSRDEKLVATGELRLVLTGQAGLSWDQEKAK